MRSKMQAAGLLSPHQQFYDPTLAGTFPIGNDPLPQPVSADIANTLDMGLIDPRRVSEVNNLLRRAPMRSELHISFANHHDNDIFCAVTCSTEKTP